MNLKRAIVTALVVMLSVLGLMAAPRKAADPKVAVASESSNSEATRVEGEQRFRANCGRCHQAPHKFPPRMMATIVRHMRVRATITDEDMRYILAYMTQ